MKNKTSSAFTLIELLTVIAIIGILAAILIPTVGRVRESAKAAQCISNIRESGNGLQILLNESDYRLITFGSGDGNAMAARWPTQLLEAGIDARDIFFCPIGKHDLVDFYTGPWDWRTYGLNMFGADGRTERAFGASADRYSMNFNVIEDPTRYILLADSVDSRGITRFRINSSSAGGNGSIHLRHSNRASVYFLDGHVELAGPEKLGQLGMISGYGEAVAEIITFPQVN